MAALALNSGLVVGLVLANGREQQVVLDLVGVAAHGPLGFQIWFSAVVG